MALGKLLGVGMGNSVTMPGFSAAVTVETTDIEMAPANSAAAAAFQETRLFTGAPSVGLKC
jgi:hypothetical protein